MKLLFDENLSFKLCARLADVFPDSAQVRQLTRAGCQPIVWIGRRDVDLVGHADPESARPIRIAAGAFAENQPARDLLLSPDHAVFADGVLIPVKHLVNGTTIRQIDVERVTYFHIELARHDIIFAEGLAAESYLDTGNRATFDRPAPPLRDAA